MHIGGVALNKIPSKDRIDNDDVCPNSTIRDSFESRVRTGSSGKSQQLSPCIQSALMSGQCLELQHVSAVYAWGCMDDIVHRVSTPLEDMMYVELRHEAVYAWSGS